MSDFPACCGFEEYGGVHDPGDGGLAFEVPVDDGVDHCGVFSQSFDVEFVKSEITCWCGDCRVHGLNGVQG